jgi:hypothetical protein
MEWFLTVEVPLNHFDIPCGDRISFPNIISQFENDFCELFLPGDNPSHFLIFVTQRIKLVWELTTLLQRRHFQLDRAFHHWL